MSNRYIDDLHIEFDVLKKKVEDDGVHPDIIIYRNLNHGCSVLSVLCYITSSFLGSPVDRVRICEYLLDHGADIEYQNRHGDTPLISSLYLRHYNLAQMLINRGANVNAINKIGTTVIQCAARARYLNIIKDLLELNVDVHKGVHNKECQSMQEYMDTSYDINKLITAHMNNNMSDLDKNNMYEYMIQENITEFLQTMRIVVNI